MYWGYIFDRVLRNSRKPNTEYVWVLLTTNKLSAYVYLLTRLRVNNSLRGGVRSLYGPLLWGFLMHWHGTARSPGGAQSHTRKAEYSSMADRTQHITNNSDRTNQRGWNSCALWQYLRPVLFYVAAPLLGLVFNGLLSQASLLIRPLYRVSPITRILGHKSRKEHEFYADSLNYQGGNGFGFVSFCVYAPTRVVYLIPSL